MEMEIVLKNKIPATICRFLWIFFIIILQYKHTKRSSDDAVDNDPRKYDTRGAAVHAAAAIAVMAEFLK